MADLKFDISKAEAKAVEAGPERMTFLASVLEARQKHGDDATVISDACTRLQGHNRKLKSLIATADAEAVNEAMNGGFLGWGCNDAKLIAVLCSRTKSQLELTCKRYRALYDRDLRDEVRGETGGNYGKMMSFAMASRTEYIIDMIDKACEGWGTAEMILIELFVMCEQKWLQEGKVAWEGRKDASLIDYITKELGSSYAGLCKLLLLLLKGEREPEEAPADEEKAQEQCSSLRAEITKGMFTSADEELFIETIGTNSVNQNMKLAELYENTYSVSLGKGIKEKMSTKLGWCLSALLMPRSDFVAMRIEKAISGWSTDKGTLLRLLGGLDGRTMVGVLEAYERKYGKPLASSLTTEIGGNFARAALTWICALDDPTGGVEEITETEVSSYEGDALKLCDMCDFLLLENEMLLRFASSLDVHTLSEAVKGIGTDDTAFIRTITTRSKRFLGRISYLYREEFDKTLSALVDDNCSGWYNYLAKFLVLQPSQSDALLLDLALGDFSVDKNALIEFLCARHPRRVRATKKTWEKRNDASLVDKLSDELDGDLRTIALTMLKGKRMVDEVDEEQADAALAKQQASELNDDITKAIEILCSNSPAQNAAIARAYEETYDCSLGRAIGREFLGSEKAALTALLLEPAQWYAARLKASFKGMGTSDRTVCRIIGAHDKDEAKAIAEAYDDKYGRRLKSDIAAECSGNYKRLAIAWLDLPDQLAQPEKTLELPEVVDEEKTPFADEEEDEDDYEEVEEAPDPSSAMYKAKIMLWKGKLEEATAEGKERKMRYYRRLLTMYPPLPQGHKILADYVEALTAEFVKGEEGMVAAWLSTVDEGAFEAAGTTKEFFDEWNNTSEDALKNKYIFVGELKNAWGVTHKKKTLPDAPDQEYETPYEKPEAPPPAPPAMAPNPLMRGMTAQRQMMANFGHGQNMMMQTMMQQQTVMQQTIIQRPAPMMGPMVQKMAATVPFGVYGGMVMTVNTTQGPMRVTVPPGYGPGSTFYFNVPVRQGVFGGGSVYA